MRVYLRTCACVRACVCACVCMGVCTHRQYMQHTRVCAYAGVYRELAEDMICLKERAAFEARRPPDQAQALSRDDGTYASHQPVCVCVCTSTQVELVEDVSCPEEKDGTRYV